MRVKVTQEHINRGLRRDCNKCPIALAIINRKNISYVRVEETIVYVARLSKVNKINRSLYLLPSEAIKFIKTFDSGSEVVKPFSFEMKKKNED